MATGNSAIKFKVKSYIHGRYFDVEAKSSDKVVEIKQQMDQEESYPIDKLCMMFNGEELLDDCTLGKYGIVSGSVIELGTKYTFYPLSQIFVKDLTGKHISLCVEPTDPVWIVKAKVQDKEGIPPSEQRLVYFGRLLEDEVTLEYYEVKNNTVFHLVLRIRG